MTGDASSNPITSPLDLDLIDIDIKFKHIQKLENNRKKAMYVEILHNSEPVPAKLRFKGKEYTASLRLKGDGPDHWSAPYKWSFRIRLDNNDSDILGFNQFSLQNMNARTRGDQVYEYWNRLMGNITPRIAYARVKVNGTSWGPMMLEEHMSKMFIEANKRKDGPIIKFGNQDSWYYLYANKNPLRPAFFDSIQASLYNERDYRSNRHFSALYSYAIKNYYSVIKGEINPKEALDLPLFYKSLLTAFAFGNIHPLQSSNFRMYMNPYTLLLEPVTTDAGQLTSNKDPANPLSAQTMRYNFLALIFKRTAENKEFSQFYEPILQEMTNLLPQVELKDKKVCAIFDPCPMGMDYEALVSEIKWLKEDGKKSIFKSLAEPMIVPGPSAAPQNIIDRNNGRNAPLDYPSHVYVEHFDDGKLVVYNLLGSSVKIEEVSLDCDSQAPKDCHSGSQIRKPILLTGTTTALNPNFVEINTKSQWLGGYSKLSIKTSADGTSRTVKTEFTQTRNTYNPLLLGETVNKWRNRPEWLAEKNKSFQIHPGIWVIDKPVIFPKETAVEILAGTTLRFKSNSYLLVQGPLIAKGSTKNPITLEPTDADWKGVYVLSANPHKSEISHVIVRDTNFFNEGILQLSGGVNFYSSDVTIDSSLFEGSLAEDSLNIVKSNFSISNTSFTKSRENALEISFSRGIASYLNFKEIGRHGLIILGTEIAGKGLTFQLTQKEAILSDKTSKLNLSQSSIDNIEFNIGELSVLEPLWKFK